MRAAPAGRSSAGSHDPADESKDASAGDPEEQARAVCLRLLDRRAYTRAELATALRKRAIPDDAAQRVLDRFGELGLIDDAGLAEQFALAAHRDRGLSGRAVALKLRQRGVDETAVQAATEQIGHDSELNQARRLVERRLPALRGLDPAVQARRLVGLLARKGYTPELAREVVRETVAEFGDVDLD